MGSAKITHIFGSRITQNLIAGLAYAIEEQFGKAEPRLVVRHRAIEP
jgi:hypothetical protein